MPIGVEKFVCENNEFLHLTSSMDEALTDADVVMMLRVQFERMNESFFPSVREYFRYFGLTSVRARQAKPDVIIMHPGPINRGVEIATDVADGPYSVILDQVSTGVAVRMAILYLLLGG
jgi:aspartate carbamoyltransferase catalytic subunit